MAKGPLAGVVSIFNRLFPERQLYHRSHGQVRFVSMSAQTQIALLIVTLAFLAWVAYASVNVVFKEQIISAKERNLVAMQANYEVRLAAAQAAYERLHTFLIQAEDRFQRETELLTAEAIAPRAAGQPQGRCAARLCLAADAHLGRQRRAGAATRSKPHADGSDGA